MMQIKGVTKYINPSCTQHAVSAVACALNTQLVSSLMPSMHGQCSFLFPQQMVSVVTCALNAQLAQLHKASKQIQTLP